MNPSHAIPADQRPGTLPEAQVVPRGDRRHSGLSRGQNQRFVSDPDYVRLPRSTSEVVGAVTRAVAERRRLTVRSGGHCYENFVDNPEVRAIVDMTEMRTIAHDPTRGAVMVQAGATLGEVYYALFRRWGVTLPGGSCYTVGIGGHVSGAGYGQMGRLQGLIVDHLQAIEVVTVGRDGRARPIVASRDPADPHHDLWWAHTGGGGGSFGVSTRYWFRSPDAVGNHPSQFLPAPPSDVWICTVTWDWADFDRESYGRLLDNYGRWHELNSDPASPYAGLFARLELTTRPNGSFSMIVQMDATRPDSRQLLERFIAAVNDGVQAFGTVGQLRRLPWLHATGWPGLWMSNPTDRYKYKSSYQRRAFSPGQVDGFWRVLSGTSYDNPGWVVSIASYGGRINTVSPTATATPHRDSVLKLLWGTAWTDAADDQRHLGFLSEFYQAVHAHTGGVPVPNEVTDGCFINYADVDISDPAQNTSGAAWHDLYWKQNYPRLQQVKARYDPNNVFRHAQSVRPAGS
ncbi:FAD-binding oxidoreductase [Solwaraspora sp. WMMD791]|uniref:FAD-binding oxidoreductase n=1 Tax=Solwaraspora sp. WMMD791 TaxID=3016086 RepID=UPI00249A7DB3|nr:FAD-binding oxidoreductase [Solwaraspora sp. WMMD791]WFE30106.1 FAD-binding oxidoreductase [Solwaraspora sp. WMMD791]